MCNDHRSGAYGIHGTWQWKVGCHTFTDKYGTCVRTDNQYGPSPAGDCPGQYFET